MSEFDNQENNASFDINKFLNCFVDFINTLKMDNDEEDNKDMLPFAFNNIPFINLVIKTLLLSIMVDCFLLSL